MLLTLTVGSESVLSKFNQENMGAGWGIVMLISPSLCFLLLAK